MGDSNTVENRYTVCMWSVCRRAAGSVCQWRPDINDPHSASVSKGWRGRGRGGRPSTEYAVWRKSDTHVSSRFLSPTKMCDTRGRFSEPLSWHTERGSADVQTSLHQLTFYTWECVKKKKLIIWNTPLLFPPFISIRGKSVDENTPSSNRYIPLQVASLSIAERTRDQ